ncbi:MAG: BamA/TamA family outer membrane protein [Myxococcota bacterium]
MTGLRGVVAVALLAAALSACAAAPVPTGTLVRRVDVIGAEKVSGTDVEDALATAETDRIFGGVLEGVPVLGAIDAYTVDYAVYDRLVLERDLARVRRLYHARGFYDVEVRAGRVVALPGGEVRIEIAVYEGNPVSLGQVEIDYPDRERNPDLNAVLLDLVKDYLEEPKARGEARPRFDEDRYDEMKRKLARALADRGYAYAAVEGDVAIDLPRRKADVRFVVEPGPRCTFGDLLIDDAQLGSIPRTKVVGAIAIEPNTTYSASKLEIAQYALADLEVFGAIQVEALRTPFAPPGSPPAKRETRIPVRVDLQPIELQEINGGVGFEFGSLIDAHARVGYANRNFLGGLRRVSATLEGSVIPFPLRLEDLFRSDPQVTEVVPELGLRFDVRQPGFVEQRTSLLGSVEGKIYLPRTTSIPEIVPEDYTIVGYRELDSSIGIERKFRSTALGGFSIDVRPFARLQIADPFTYNDQDLDPAYDNVFIPYLDWTVTWDMRKNRAGRLDPINPELGFSLALNAQFAFGSAFDVRLRPELRVFVPLAKRVVLAGKWATGYLFPFNYGGSLSEAPEPDARDQQLLSFRGFFSGGPYSNRGYGYRDVGPHAELTFLSAAGSRDGLAPIGGLGMWEISGELRFLLTETLIGVTFVDMSDVVRTLADFRATHPHLSPGVGLRYASPLGIKLRLDLGVRVPFLQRVGFRDLAPAEGGPPIVVGPDGEPTQDSDDFPVALNLAIGEAF